MNYQKIVHNLLEGTGISINGQKPEDIKVKDDRFFKKVVQNGSLALGESYMKGWWECEALDVFFEKILKARLDKKVRNNLHLSVGYIKSWLFNQQNKAKSVAAIDQHYNIGNDLYKAMLDRHMMYSCGYWENTNDLSHAQLNKLELICQKLHLKAGQQVLEIGCGWGGFAAYAAQNYDVEVTGVTISTEQVKWAKKWCAGLNVDIRLLDYRELNEQFDRIVSIGMFEHVGYKNYATYMDVVNRNLKEDGISLLHTIGSSETSIMNDPWIHKYIFKNSLIPSMSQIASALESQNFVMQDWHNFGRYYDYTLMAWRNNFLKAWHTLKKKYDETFFRMWFYYLSCCAASFRVGNNSLWQIVFTKQSYPEMYQSIRSVNKPKKEVSLVDF